MKKNVAKKQIHRTTETLETLRAFLSNEKKPLSVLDIAKKTKQVPSTIYRLLEKLVKTGEVIALAHGKTIVYEYQKDEHHHHHIRCVECGLVGDINDCLLDSKKISNLLKQVAFAELTSHSFELSGRCNKCVSSN